MTATLWRCVVFNHCSRKNDGFALRARLWGTIENVQRAGGSVEPTTHHDLSIHVALRFDRGEVAQCGKGSIAERREQLDVLMMKVWSEKHCERDATERATRERNMTMESTSRLVTENTDGLRRR